MRLRRQMNYDDETFQCRKLFMKFAISKTDFLKILTLQIENFGR